jgi:hypothetical protein
MRNAQPKVFISVLSVSLIPIAASIDAGSGPGHWSFQPLLDPPLPAVKDASWPSAPWDRFVLARLEREGLRPAPPAEARVWLRRVTFDLTGLPPTPEEIDRFLADGSPDAKVRTIDRLLASPRYGERWGRHWLDVARYADSNGLDENVAHGNAYRYRDYVVAAFNADRPFDQFILEQIAGDLLPPAGDQATREARLIATGFLSLGPKVLAEVDEKKMEMDIVDEQVDTAGKAFLALSLGCARCHDHKFDPVSSEDYYALAGIFKSTRTMESFTKVARWHENELAKESDLERKRVHEREVASRKSEIQALVDSAKEALQSAGRLGSPPPKEVEPLFSSEVKERLKTLREGLAALERDAPEMPSAMGVKDGTPADLAIHVRGDPQTLGSVVPRRFPRALAGARQPPIDGSRSGRLELARWLVGRENPLTARVLVNRVWRWHFGRGLVATVDDFGTRGARPEHPELLDWLACRLVESGWSLKSLHRIVLLSQTYAMGSDGDPRALERDPDNVLLSRNRPRRLEAEAIRDAMLFAGGTLDFTMGGSLLQVKNRGYLFDHTSLDGTRYEVRRRSLYLPVIRNHLYDFFQIFDSTDAAVLCGDRPTTTVPSQALLFLNGDLALAAAEALAERLLREAGPGDGARLDQLYLRAYGRPARASETRRDLDFLERFRGALAGEEPDPRKRLLRAWALLAQAILSANEFVYLQ